VVLTQQTPANAQRQIVFSVGETIGDVLAAQGDLAGALAILSR